jgi:hypothetical protein
MSVIFHTVTFNHGIIQGVLEGKVNILEGHSIGHI